LFFIKKVSYFIKKVSYFIKQVSYFIKQVSHLIKPVSSFIEHVLSFIEHVLLVNESGLMDHVLLRGPPSLRDFFVVPQAARKKALQSAPQLGALWVSSGLVNYETESTAKPTVSVLSVGPTGELFSDR
jgi:hypothetical protein